MEGLFDTHAHYDHVLFQTQGAEILRDLFDRHIITGCVIPAISYESNFNRYMFPKEDFPKVYFAAGLHPKVAVNEAWWTKDKQTQFEALLSDERTVAIKTGLDFSKKRLTEAQKEHQMFFFRFFIDLANQHDLPLVLHIRNAALQAIEVLRDCPPSVETVIHCFVYDKNLADMMMKVGITRFGIGSMMEREGMDDLRDCVQHMPIENIMLETDAPFVKPPDMEKGMLNTSETLLQTVGKICELKGDLSAEELISMLNRNAEEFFKL